MTKNRSSAKRHLSKARKLASHHPPSRLTHEEVIQKSRRIREQLWEEKLAARS